MVGSNLVSFLLDRNNEVWRLVRKGTVAPAPMICWDDRTGEADTSAFEGMDVVIHLAGENLAGRRWHKAQKDKIRESRVFGTANLVRLLTALKSPPATLICASAVGYYGNQSDTEVTEDGAVGQGFLAGLVKDWEGAGEAAVAAGIRVVHLRLGMVLAKSGGALAKMVFPFKFGLGAILGNGKQAMPWIHIADVQDVVGFLLNNRHISGAVNVVAPETVDNRTFSRTLGRVLKRPVFFSVPAFFLRMVFGEMADELLLSGARVKPQKLISNGYPFHFSTLEDALRNLLTEKRTT